MIKLIATDMDHTLLDNDSLLPVQIREILELCKKKNVTFVAASGRTLHSIETKFGNLADSITIISDNGSLLKKDGIILFEERLSSDDAHVIVSAGRTLPETSIVLTGLKNSYILSSDENHKEFLKEYYQNAVYCDDLTPYLDLAIKITFLSIHETHSNYDLLIQKGIPQDVTALKSGKVWIDIMKRDISKGSALKFLLDRLNISPDDAAAFGDYDNDVKMLETVHHSYCVSNASDAVKAVAKEMIGDNHSQSVAKKMLELLSK